MTVHYKKPRAHVTACGLPSQGASYTAQPGRTTCTDCVAAHVVAAVNEPAKNLGTAPTHLIVDVTPNALARQQTALACGAVVKSTTNLTRNQTLVTCARCLDELRERFAPNPAPATNPLNAPSPAYLAPHALTALRDLVNALTADLNDPQEPTRISEATGRALLIARGCLAARDTP